MQARWRDVVVRVSRIVLEYNSSQDRALSENVVTTREEEIRENIRVFDKLTASQKLKRIEQERRRLRYVRTLVTRPPSSNENREPR